MTSTSKIRFDENAVSLAIGNDSIQFAAANKIKDHADVRLTAFGDESFIEHFAFITSKWELQKKESKWELWVNVIQPDEDFGHWILVVGNLKCLVVDFSLRKCSPIDLFRSISDDQGFYYLRTANVGSSLLVEYDGGLFIVTGGEVRWHIKKLWNDKVRAIHRGTVVVDGMDDKGADCVYEVDLLTGEKRG